MANSSQESDRPDAEGNPRKSVDVMDMLKENHEAQQAVEKRDLPPMAKRRKRRDYLIVMTSGNGLLVGLYWLLPSNLVTAVFTLSGIVLLSIGVTWAFFMVMSDY